MGDFYGNSGGNGGGFMESSEPKQQFSQSSQGNNTTEGKPRSHQSLIPLTIKQIISAVQNNPDDAWQIEGREVSHVSFVGAIIQIDEASTSLNFVIEDGTGRIEAKHWLDDGDADFASKRAQWVEGSYVQVVGNIREFHGNKNIVAFDVRPVVDFNQITHHLLEAIWVHLKNKEPVRQPMGQTMATSNNNMQMGSTGFNGNAQTDFSQNANDSESALQNMVLQCIHTMQQEFPDGVDIRKVTEELVSKGQNAANINKAIAFLQDEGNLYSTTDDFHVKSTEW